MTIAGGRVLLIIRNKTVLALVAFLIHLLYSPVFLFANGIGGEDGEKHELVKCDTTKGPLLIEVIPEWAPLGAARFVELVRDGFYTDIAFFRCVNKFLTQFGISEDVNMKHWHNKNIKDDPNTHHIPISKHVISYAGGGPNTRSTQIFIAFEDLDFLGKAPWEVPFGRVIQSDQTLNALYKGYGDIPPFGKGPDQQMIHRLGNDYIRKNFPKTDFLQRCWIVGEEIVQTNAGKSDSKIRLDKSEKNVEEEEYSKLNLRHGKLKGAPEGPDSEASAKGGKAQEILVEEEEDEEEEIIIQQGKLIDIKEADELGEESDGDAQDANTYTTAFAAVCFVFVALMALITLQKYRIRTGGSGLGKSN